MANYIVLDTETTNGFDDPFTYDMGWAVINDDCEIIKPRSFVVADVFIDEPELMKQAFFADKIPQYIADIADGKRELRKYSTIRKILREDCEKYNVKAIMAHNMRFDYRSATRTQRWLTSSKSRYFFPYGVELWDTLRMAKQTFAKDENYKNFCKQNGYVTKANQPQLTAEVLYRFITNDPTFTESHTGYEDVTIEKEIFGRCMAMNPEISKSVWGD